MLNDPSFLVSAVTSSPVEGFTTFTTAPAIVAPELSETVPLIDPTVCCAFTAVTLATANTDTTNTHIAKRKLRITDHPFIKNFVRATTALIKKTPAVKRPDSVARVYHKPVRLL
jgi:hypothetical protein